MRIVRGHVGLNLDIFFSFCFRMFSDLIFYVLGHAQVTTIGRAVWTPGCCGYGRTARGRWCPRTRRGPRIRSPGPAGVCVSRPTLRPRCTRTRARSAATGTGTCANTRKTRRTRRWAEYTKRWRTAVGDRLFLRDYTGRSRRRRREQSHILFFRKWLLTFIYLL